MGKSLTVNLSNFLTAGQLDAGVQLNNDSCIVVSLIEVFFKRVG